MRKIEVTKNKGVPMDDLGMFLRDKFHGFADDIERTQKIYNHLRFAPESSWAGELDLIARNRIEYIFIGS